MDNPCNGLSYDRPFFFFFFYGINAATKAFCGSNKAFKFNTNYLFSRYNEHIIYMMINKWSVRRDLDDNTIYFSKLIFVSEGAIMVQATSNKR